MNGAFQTTIYRSGYNRQQVPEHLSQITERQFAIQRPIPGSYAGATGNAGGEIPGNRMPGLFYLPDANQYGELQHQQVSLQVPQEDKPAGAGLDAGRPLQLRTGCTDNPNTAGNKKAAVARPGDIAFEGRRPRAHKAIEVKKRIGTFCKTEV